MFPPTPHLFYLGAEKTSSNKSPNPQGPWGFLRRVFLRWYPWSHSAGWGLCWWENPPRRHSRPEFGEDFLGWIYPKPPRIKVHVASRFSPFIKHSFSSFEGQRLLFEILAQKFSSLQDKQWTLKNKKPITHLHRVTKKKLLNFTKKSALFFFLHPDFVVPPFGFLGNELNHFALPRGGIFGGTQALEIAPATSKLILIIPEKNIQKKQVVPYENLWSFFQSPNKRKIMNVCMIFVFRSELWFYSQ